MVVGSMLSVYTAYIPGIYCLLGGLYNPYQYHLSPEPEKSIEQKLISWNTPPKKPLQTGDFSRDSFHSWLGRLSGVCDIGVCCNFLGIS